MLLNKFAARRLVALDGESARAMPIRLVTGLSLALSVIAPPTLCLHKIAFVCFPRTPTALQKLRAGLFSQFCFASAARSKPSKRGFF